MINSIKIAAGSKNRHQAKIAMDDGFIPFDLESKTM